MMAVPERCCTSRPERPATPLLMLWAVLLFPSVSCLQLSSHISSGTRILGVGTPSLHVLHASTRPTTTTSTTLHVLQNTWHAKTLPAQRSALFSSPGTSVDGDGRDGKKKGGRGGGGGGRWIGRLNPIPRVKKLVSNIIAFQTAFRTRFAALPRKAKMVVLAQLLALGLVVGSVGQKVYVNTSQGQAAARPVEVPYSTFMDMTEISGKGHVPGKNPAILVDNVVIGRDRVGFRLSQDEEKHQVALQDKKLGEDDPAVKSIGERRVYAMKPLANQDMIDFLRGNGIPFRAASTKGSNAAATVARSAIFLIYVLFLLRMYRSMSGGGGSGDAPGKLALSMDDETIVKFEDIEGIDKAKFEVMEFVDTLRHPQKYAILGARPPTGLLLEGPPGTGKTMLARATAASAGVPLLYCSGSDFVEMFVGRGAARVRKTFARAAKMAPCIIFIDELDALGKSRTMGGLGANLRSNDEAEQTLNQLLACMDGLDSSRGVCVLAATNRREILDPALVRPGRFDRLIKVELPDLEGRERILRVHAKKLPGFSEGKGIDEKRLGSLGKGKAVDLSAIAAVTNGLCGAELEFVVNEAAIRAVRRVSSQLNQGKEPRAVTPQVTAEDFEASVANYYATRKPGGGAGGVGQSLFNALTK